MPHETGVDTLYWYDLNWVDDGAKRNRLREGAYSGLSTGSITLDYKMEDIESGDLLSVEDAEKKYDDWEIVLAFWGASDKLILVMTEWELVEHSKVTIPSNPDALSFENSLQKFFTTEAMKNPKFAALKDKLLKARNAAEGGEEPAPAGGEGGDQPTESDAGQPATPAAGATPGEGQGAGGATPDGAEPQGTAEEKIKWHEQKLAELKKESPKETVEESAEFTEVISALCDAVLAISTNVADVKKALAKIPQKEALVPGAVNQFGNALAPTQKADANGDKPKGKFLQVLENAATLLKTK